MLFWFDLVAGDTHFKHLIFSFCFQFTEWVWAICWWWNTCMLFAIPKYSDIRYPSPIFQMNAMTKFSFVSFLIFISLFHLKWICMLFSWVFKWTLFSLYRYSAPHTVTIQMYFMKIKPPKEISTSIYSKNAVNWACWWGFYAYIFKFDFIVIVIVSITTSIAWKLIFQFIPLL